MRKTVKKRVFCAFFEDSKKQKTRPQELKSVDELIDDPLSSIRVLVTFVSWGYLTLVSNSVPLHSRTDKSFLEA